MGDLSPGALALITLILLFGGFIKGALGFGTNLVAIPLLALFVEPRTVVPLLVLPALASLPVVLVRLHATPAEARRLAPFLLTLALGTVAGASLLVILSRTTIATVVGLAVMGFALLGAARLQPRIGKRHEPWITPLAGLGCGLIAGAAAVHGPAVASYLHGRGLEKREFLVSFAFVFVVTGTVQLVSYGALGLYTPGLLLASLLACVPATLGTELGVRTQHRLHQTWFNRLVLAVIFVSGLSLLPR